MDGWAALAMFAVFVGVGFGWRSWFHRRRFGSSGIVLFRSGRWSQHLRETGLLLLAVVVTWQAVAALAAPAAVDGMRLLPGGPALRWLGIVLMGANTALMVAAQLDMGVSWRVGVDEAARPGLVVGGLYRVCRNPIYVAVLGALAGYAALLPTWPSLVMLVGTAAVIRNQAREEEAYLLRAYGAAYAAYARRVGRFLPGVGRLAMNGDGAEGGAARTA